MAEQPQAPAKKTTSSPSSTDGQAPRTIIERIRKPRADLSRLSICIYARGGVGKTTLLGTMPGKGLLIDIPQIEGGDSVLADRENIMVAPTVTWDELDDIYKYLAKGGHDYRWVAIDTITAAQELAKRKAIKERELSADPHTVSLQEWGKIGELMRELFYRFRLLPINTILLAQERSPRDREGARDYHPAVSPLSLEALMPPQHLVGRLYVWQKEDEAGNVVWERRLRTAPHEMYLTKVRNVKGRELPPVVREPHLGRILAYMLGKDVAPPEAASDEMALDLDLT